MILTLIVQYNYNGKVSIAEPVATRFFDYVEVTVANTLEEAKQRATELYSDYKVIFIDDEGNEV